MARLEFAGHVLDLQQGRLRKDGRDVPLRHKSLLLLVYLLHNRGRVLGKEELLDAGWPGLTVGDDSLSQCIADIRRTLGPRAKDLIRTMPRRGYLLDEALVRSLPDRGEPTLGIVARAEPVRPERPLPMLVRQGRPTATGENPALVFEEFWGQRQESPAQRLWRYSTPVLAAVIAASSLSCAPLIGIGPAFGWLAGLLVVLAILRSLRTDSLNIGSMLAVQQAATAAICLGLSLAGTSLHLFQLPYLAPWLQAAAIAFAGLSLSAAWVHRVAGPRPQRHYRTVNYMLAGGTGLCLWLVPDPFDDPAASLTLLLLLLLQVPALVVGSRTSTRWGAARSVQRPAEVTVAVITPGCSMVMEAHPRQLTS